MFENPKRGRQERNFTTNVPKILDLKSSSEQILSENWRWVPLRHGHALLSLSLRFSSKWRLREQKHSRTQRKCLQWRLTDVLSRNNRNHNRLRLLNKQNVVDRDRARILLTRGAPRSLTSGTSGFIKWSRLENEMSYIPFLRAFL